MQDKKNSSTGGSVPAYRNSIDDMIPTSAELRRLLGILNEEEFQTLMGFGGQTLRQWRVKNLGPDYSKCGKQVFYRVDDIMEWFANCRVATNHHAPLPE